MEIEVTKDLDLQLISLEEIKKNLRISHSNEDTELLDLAQSAVEYWQNQTSYFINATQLKISFIPERDVLAPPRQDFLSFREGDLFSPPLAIDIASQAPTSVRYIKEIDNKIIDLTADQIQALESNFFTVWNKIPLQFKIYHKNYLQGFSYRSLITLTLSANGLAVTADIKRSLLRIIAGLYENPDVPIDFKNDPFVMDTISAYNCNIGIGK